MKTNPEKMDSEKMDSEKTNSDSDRIIIKGKPSLLEVLTWQIEKTPVYFIVKNKVYKGKILACKPMGSTNAKLRIREEEVASPVNVVYLKEIIQYGIPKPKEPLLLDPKSNLPKVTLIGPDKTYCVDKKILSKRLGFLPRLFPINTKESGEQEIDLRRFTPEELDILLSVANGDHCKPFTLKEACLLLDAARKANAIDLAAKAQDRINTCMQRINPEFLLMVSEGNYSRCDALLLEGADTNQKMGGYSTNKHDTPLTYTVKKGNVELVALLLKHAANPNVFAPSDTPLIIAVRKHNVEIVRLLLEAGADPNAKSVVPHTHFSLHPPSHETAMHALFDDDELNFCSKKLLATKTKQCEEIFQLLIKKGYSCNSKKAKEIEHYLSGIGKLLFTQIWQKHCELERFYTRGAVAGILDQAASNKTISETPTELFENIASFLHSNVGAKSLARTCKKAAHTASQTREQGKDRINQRKVKQEIQPPPSPGL